MIYGKTWILANYMNTFLHSFLMFLSLFPICSVSLTTCILMHNNVYPIASHVFLIFSAVPVHRRVLLFSIQSFPSFPNFFPFFPMVFLSFSHGFPMIFPFSHGFPHVFSHVCPSQCHQCPIPGAGSRASESPGEVQQHRREDPNDQQHIEAMGLERPWNTGSSPWLVETSGVKQMIKHGLMGFNQQNGGFNGIYPLVNQQFAIEHSHL